MSAFADAVALSRHAALIQGHERKRRAVSLRRNLLTERRRMEREPGRSRAAEEERQLMALMNRQQEARGPAVNSRLVLGH